VSTIFKIIMKAPSCMI